MAGASAVWAAATSGAWLRAAALGGFAGGGATLASAGGDGAGPASVVVPRPAGKSQSTRRKPRLGSAREDCPEMAEVRAVMASRRKVPAGVMVIGSDCEPPRMGSNVSRSYSAAMARSVSYANG